MTCATPWYKNYEEYSNDKEFFEQYDACDLNELISECSSVCSDKTTYYMGIDETLDVSLFSEDTPQTFSTDEPEPVISLPSIQEINRPNHSFSCSHQDALLLNSSKQMHPAELTFVIGQIPNFHFLQRE